MMDLYCVNLANQTIFPKYSLPCIVSLDHMRHPLFEIWMLEMKQQPSFLSWRDRYRYKVLLLQGHTHCCLVRGHFVIMGQQPRPQRLQDVLLSLSDFWVRCNLKSLIKGVIFCFRKPLSSELETWI